MTTSRKRAANGRALAQSFDWHAVAVVTRRAARFVLPVVVILHAAAPAASLQRHRQGRLARACDNQAMRATGVGAQVLGALFCGIVALGTLLTAGCGGSATSQKAAGTPVVQAAYVTARGPGLRFALTTTFAIGEEHVAFSGEGATDERGRVGTVKLNIKGKQLEEILLDPYIYVRVPGKTVHGRHWVKVNQRLYSEAFGVRSPLGSETQSPREFLGLLRTAGHAKVVGNEALRGVPVTHYHAMVDFSRYAPTVAKTSRAEAESFAATMRKVTGSTTLPMDVWIDKHEHIRRLSMNMRLCAPEGTGSVSIVVDYLGFGRPPAVAVPPAFDVADVTNKIKSNVTQSIKQFGCH
jgi:hypothetical protein